MNWTMIKCLAAHGFADYGAQTSTMARHKNECHVTRTEHVAVVAGAFAVALATDDKLTWLEKLLIIAANVTTHFVIDSFKPAKWLDQLLHIIVAIGSVLAIVRTDG